MDSKSAYTYLIDPLTAPEPAEETGPGSHFYPPVEASTSRAATSSPTLSTNNPFRRESLAANAGPASSHSRQASTDFSAPTKDGGYTHVRQASRDDFSSTKGGSTTVVRQASRDFGSPRSSPRRDKFPNYREEELGRLNDGPAPRRSADFNYPPTYDDVTGRRRGSSLRERYPGDSSNKPLDVIRRDSKKANRSPHLNKRHIPGADVVDRLDPTSVIPYHHEGPYDAAMLARNTSYTSSPIAALESSNREALKATPNEKIRDAVEKHMPLEGVGIIPPGEIDSFGRRYDYEEGENMMIAGQPQGGAYKRVEGVEYADDDIGGQGERSRALDRALQAHTIHERDFDGHVGFELSDRSHMRKSSIDTRDPVDIAGGESKYLDMQTAMDPEAHGDAHVTRTGSLRHAGEGLKRRIGSLRHKNVKELYYDLNDHVSNHL